MPDKIESEERSVVTESPVALPSLKELETYWEIPPDHILTPRKGILGEAKTYVNFSSHRTGIAKRIDKSVSNVRMITLVWYESMLAASVALCFVYGGAFWAVTAALVPITLFHLRELTKLRSEHSSTHPVAPTDEATEQAQEQLSSQRHVISKQEGSTRLETPQEEAYRVPDTERLEDSSETEDKSSSIRSILD